MTADSSTSSSNSQYPADGSISVNTNNLIERQQQSSINQCWFLSVSCLDDIAERFTTTPNRSAFDPYQRPVHVMSLFDASLERDDQNDDERETNENIPTREGEIHNAMDEDDEDGDDEEEKEPFHNGHSWPLIERTFSFDDWKLDDESEVIPPPPPISPVAFRFDEGIQETTTTTIPRVVSQDYEYHPGMSTSYDDLRLSSSGRSNSRFFIEQSFSMRPRLPSSDSFLFQPVIQDDPNSWGTEDDTSAVQTMSVVSIDSRSLYLDREIFTTPKGMRSPECRGIQRLATFEDWHGQCLPLGQFEIELTWKKIHDKSNHATTHHQCHSSASPPIPEFIFVPSRRPTTTNTTAQKPPKKSWKTIIRIGRNKKESTSRQTKKSRTSVQRGTSKSDF